MNREIAEEETTQLVENNIRSIRNGEFMIEEHQFTSPNEIANIIKKMRPHKAPGEDNIQGTVLKKLPKK